MRLISLFALSLFGCSAGLDTSHIAAESTGQRFVWGTEEAPTLFPPGPGAGEWDSEHPRPDNVILARSAKSYLGSSDARRRYGDEAAGTFEHYFDNSGLDYEVSVAQLIFDVPRVASLFQELIDQVVTKVFDQGGGKVKFSMSAAEMTTIDRAESENWYLAVAGFSYWISGEIAAAPGDGALAGRIMLNLWDKYDWDPGVVIPISTPFGRVDVDQDRVGEFHRQGLAKEFDTRGCAEMFFGNDNFEVRTCSVK